jgi:hypothetical protein
LIIRIGRARARAGRRSGAVIKSGYAVVIRTSGTPPIAARKINSAMSIASDPPANVRFGQNARNARI